MPEGLRWERLKRKGLAPGFVCLVHQHIKGRKTGALKHQRSLERSEDGHERCWSHGGGMLKGPFSGPWSDCRRNVLLSQLVKAVGPKRQARGLRRPHKALGHYGRRGMYTEYKTSFTHLRSFLVQFTDCRFLLASVWLVMSNC